VDIIVYYFQRLRKLIAAHTEQEAHEVFEGEIVYTKIILDSIVYSDRWRVYNVLDVSEFKPKANFGLFLK